MAALFCDYKLLTLDNIHSLIVLFMFFVKTKTIPNTFHSIFSKNFENHHIYLGELIYINFLSYLLAHGYGTPSLLISNQDHCYILSEKT